MKRIIIITHKYPFSPPCEQFLHNEIPYISKKFDEVFIIPVSHFANGESQEIKYDNVFIKKAKRRNKFIEVLFALLFHCLINFAFYKDLFLIIKKRKVFSKKYINRLISSYVNDLIICKEIRMILNKTSINDQNIIYTYWLGSTSGITIKKKYIKKGFNIKTISRAHGKFDIFDYRSKSDIRLKKKKLINGIDCIFSISDEGKKSLIEEGFLPHRIVVSRLGIEKRIDNIPKKINKEIFHIVSCSSMTPNKRIEKIIVALSNLKNCIIEWNHFGNGPLIEVLSEMAKKMLPQNIHWHFHGCVNNKKIRDFYTINNVNLFINVSEMEGIPVSIMEAISCGIPIIATNVGGNKEICHNDINGFLIDSIFSETKLSELLLLIMNFDEDKYSILCKNSIKIFDEKYNANKNFSEFTDKILKI